MQRPGLRPAGGVMEMRDRTACVIQHIAFEGLGGFAGPLADAGYSVRTVNAADGIPEQIGEEDLLFVLGGPVSANDTASYPFLRDELRLISRRLEKGLPLVGVCLGAQLIAKAAGARIYPQAEKEIGFAPIALSEAGRASCLSVFDTNSITFHWHGETFDLPAGAVNLASSAMCQNQAFAFGNSVIGFQFHPEAVAEEVEHWLIGHAAELFAAGVDPVGIRQDARYFRHEMRVKSAAVMKTWLQGLPAVPEASHEGRITNM